MPDDSVADPASAAADASGATPPGADLPPESLAPAVPADDSERALRGALYAAPRLPTAAVAVFSHEPDPPPPPPPPRARASAWERDEDVDACRGCGRAFTFFFRRHHCRRCGRIFCDACTPGRERLGADELVCDPDVPDMLSIELEGPSRVCTACATDGGEHSGEHGGDPNSSLFGRVLGLVQRTSSGEDAGGTGDPNSSLFGRVLGLVQRGPSGEGDAGGDAASLDECPVCEQQLRMPARAREAHIDACLAHGQPRALNSTRYLVAALAPDSPLVGRECIICMEEFEAGAPVARLHCLCCFHRACIDAWMRSGGACPTHTSSLYTS